MKKVKQDSKDLKALADQASRMVDQNIPGKPSRVLQKWTPWQALPKDFDPSKPIAPAKYEHFVLDISQNCEASTAYRRHISNTCSRHTAKSSASRLLNSPACSARIRWLQEHQAANNKSAVVLIEEMKFHLSAIARTGGASDRVRAMAELRKIEAEEQDKVIQTPDPGFVCEYLAGGSGRTPEQFVKDLGGLPAILDRIKALCHVSNAQIKAALDHPADKGSASQGESVETVRENEDKGTNEGANEDE